MITHSRTIVLSHLRYGDNSLIVHLYTECLGRQTAFVKGAFSKKSPIRAALFQPLHFIELDLHHRINRQMQQVSNVQVLYPFQTIPFDPVKSSIALFISEILHKTLKEEEPNPGLFDFLTHAVQALDLNNNGTANFHLMFLTHYTRYLGFYPDTKRSFFDTHQGSSIGIPAFFMEYQHFFTQLRELSFEHLDALQMNHHRRNHLTECLLNYYSMHIDGFGKVKSFPILRDIFQE